MRPLSQNRRRFYAYSLIGFFIVIFPLLALYAKGYRFNLETGFDIVETGGIYVGTDEASAEIYINDELVRETGTFRRAFFVQNLEPGVYSVRVEKEGHYPWLKTLTVYPQVVTEARAFNMPQDLILELIPEWIPIVGDVRQLVDRATTTATSTATSTRLKNQRYFDVLALFSTSTEEHSTTTIETVLDLVGVDLATTTATTTLIELATTTKEFRGMLLTEHEEGVQAVWSRNEKDKPFYFCEFGSVCQNEITLNTNGEMPLWFDFFPGSTDLAVVALTDGIFVTEFDNRSGQNIQPIIIGDDVDFRIFDGDVYIKEDARLYRVEI